MVDFTVSNILMPLGALLLSIFIPLKIPKEELFAEMRNGSNVGKGFFYVWYYLLRFVVPLAIIIVFLNLIGIFREKQAGSGPVFYLALNGPLAVCWNCLLT